MNIGTLTIEMAANVARLSKDMDAARRTVERTFGSIEKDVARLKDMIGGLFAGVSATMFVGKLVAVQREFDVLNSSLKTVTGSAAAAEREMAWLKQFAKETPFGLAQATQGFVKMQALGLNPTRAALTSFGNTASAMGKDLNQMIEAVADASTGEFERLKEFGIKAKKEGDNVSLTFQGVTTNIGNNAAEITAYLQAIGDNQFAGAMAERAKTLDGAIAGLGDTWDELFRTINAQPAGGIIYDSVVLATNAIEDMITILNALNGATAENAKQTGAMKVLQDGMAIVFETVAVLGVNLKYVLVQIGNEIGGIAAQIAAVLRGDFAQAGAIRDMMVADAEAARKEVDAVTARILNARKEALAAQGVQQAVAAGAPAVARALGGSSDAAKKFADQLENLLNKINGKDAGVDADFYKNLELLRDGYNKGKLSLEEYMALAEKYIKQQKFYQDQVKESAAAEEERRKAVERAAEEYAKAIQSAEDMVDQIQFETRALQMTNVEREVAIRLRDLERKGIKAGSAEYEEYARRIREAVVGKETVEASLEQQRKATKEWEKTWDQVGQSFTDALMQGGKSVKEYLISLFRTMVLRPMLQPIVGGIMGAFGLGGTANAATGGTVQNALGLGNFISAAKGVYDTVTGGFAALGDKVTGVASDIGVWLAENTTGVLKDAGAKLVMGAESVGTMASYIGGIAAGYGIGTMISGKYAAFGNANVSTVAGTAIGAVLGGPIGAAIGGAIGGLINRAFGRGPKEVQDYGVRGTFSSTGATVEQYSRWKQDGGWFRSDRSGTDVSAVASEMQMLLDAALQTTASTVKGYVEVLGMSSDAVAGYNKAVTISMNGLNAEQQQKAVADALSAFGDTMVESLYSSVLQFQRVGESAGETLSRLATSLQTVNGVFDALGLRLLDTNIAAGNAASGLVSLFGSMEGFVQATDFYYQNFYSEAERTANTLDQLSVAFQSLGVAVPTTREAFRDLVTAARDAEDAQLFSSLLKLAPTFASVTTQLQSTAQAAAQIEADMREQQQRAEAIASERASLERQLLELQGDSAALAEIERSSLSEANRVIYDRIQAIKAEQEASRNAAEAERLLAEARNRINEQAYALQGRLLQLQGDTIALRARELAETDEANRYILERIYAIEDERAATAAAIEQQKQRKDAAEKATNAAFAALERAIDAQRTSVMAMRDAAQEQVDSVTAVFDVLKSNIEDLYNEAASTSAMGAAAGQAFIAQALATARSTGYLPDSNELSQAIGAARGGLASGRYASAFEAERDRLVLAGRLSQLREISGNQLTTAEQQLKVAEQQLDSLDGQLATARAQLDAMRGVDQRVLTVEQAIRELTVAMAAELRALGGALAASKAPSAAYSVEDTPAERQAKVEYQTGVKVSAADSPLVAAAKVLYQSIHGGASTAEYNAAAAAVGGNIGAALGWNGSAEDAERIRAQYGFAAGGLHDGGVRMVGENGPEIEVTGPARYYSAGQTAAMLGGGAEVANEVRQLREENQAQARAMVQLQARVTRLLERWDGDGMPETRSVTA